MLCIPNFFFFFFFLQISCSLNGQLKSQGEKQNFFVCFEVHFFINFHFIFPNQKIACLYLPFNLDTWLLGIVRIFVKVILNLCIPGHIRLLERLGCFEDVSWSCLWSFCVQLKIKTASDGFFYFWITHAKWFRISNEAMEPVGLGCYFHSQTLPQWSELDWEDGLIM